MSRRPQQGAASHALMLPPVGYKFIPKSDKVCGAPGCFECYDIYCQRCESKDRRIMELEMRNNDLCKNLTLLQGQLFAKIQQHQESGSSRKGETLSQLHTSMRSSMLRNTPSTEFR
ncbi:hypothetical protein FOZ63_012356, partial [Perkinsus olseni]